MTVYVDALRQYRADLADHETRRAGARHGHRWAHLLALPDDEEELHALARRIGIRRDWFQKTNTPHYDVTPTRRQEALRAGAAEANREKVLEIMRAWREVTKARLRKRDEHAAVDALLHPDGRCSCVGEGSCQWCWRHGHRRDRR